ncbi:MAG: HAD-IA family hydrolase [Cyanobacteria bacterium]|nr:HAD-IA family hydrolase [Cyanobacteriota bacterium]MDA1246635.1 HAD-IA family hydrolase [Cyanobacteriota bacterium]
MAKLFLRGQPLADATGTPFPIEAVLFDKDGTLCISEPMLHALAEARVFHARQLLLLRHPELPASQGDELGQLLKRAYGLSNSAIHPAGSTAVGSRSQNLISTATALAQVGLGWPEALELSESVFAATDGLHGQGSKHRPIATDGLHDLMNALQESRVVCAVISNDDEAGIESFLASQNLRSKFQALWSADQNPRKPDPAAVHALCAQLGIQAKRCALIGDANSDLRMAQQAGVPVVLGYGAGWSIAPPLDTSFACLQHWRELQVEAGQPIS